MAASDPDQRPTQPQGRVTNLSSSGLARRLEEEINRAARHGTALSCLLVAIDSPQELVREHGAELLEQTLTYIGQALRRGLRNFDRVDRSGEGELLVVLPGADDLRGEIVARRLLARLATIKLESGGTRRPLRISVGLAAWRADATGEDLLAQTRASLSKLRSLGPEEMPSSGGGETGNA